MQLTTPLLTESLFSPVLSSQNQGWDNILLEQFQPPAGEANCPASDDPTIYLSLASRPVRLLQIQEGKTYQGLYAKGDIAINPQKTPFFARWDSDDHFLQIRLASHFLNRIAQETLDRDPDQLELRSEFRTRDPHIESLGTLLLTELQQAQLGERLYVESLANVLSVHLLRHYATVKPRLATYTGGLRDRQVLYVLEYIHEYLDQDIKLADLAALLSMSPFHFSRLFKQSLGIPPYQYLLQQRVERAKQLLKQTDQSIMDIAFLCGFSSHSHLSKQFRHLTGMTPKAYRAQLGLVVEGGIVGGAQHSTYPAFNHTGMQCHPYEAPNTPLTT